MSPILVVNVLCTISNALCKNGPALYNLLRQFNSNRQRNCRIGKVVARQPEQKQQHRTIEPKISYDTIFFMKGITDTATKKMTEVHCLNWQTHPSVHHHHHLKFVIEFIQKSKLFKISISKSCCYKLLLCHCHNAFWLHYTTTCRCYCYCGCRYWSRSRRRPPLPHYPDKWKKLQSNRNMELATKTKKESKSKIRSWICLALHSTIFEYPK